MLIVFKKKTQRPVTHLYHVMLKRFRKKSERGNSPPVFKVKIQSVWECGRETLNGSAVSVFPQRHQPKTANTPVDTLQHLWQAVVTKKMT